MSDVTITLQGNRVLEDVSFECRAGEWTLIYGVSGSGKSTLLRAVNELCLPDRGCIWTLGTPIPGRSRAEARTVWRQTGTVLQEVALFETKNAVENVVLALQTVGVDRQLAREEATAWLERLKIGHKVHEYPAHLSGGERQRVALARACAIRPRLLILDEPTSAIDEGTAEIVLSAVKELVEHGTAVVMSSHRMGEVAELCDQRIGLEQGRITTIDGGRSAGEYATVQEVQWLSDDQHPHVQQVSDNVIGGVHEGAPPSVDEQGSLVRRVFRMFL